MEDIRVYLDAAVEATEKAERVLLRYYNDMPQHQNKEDSSPVTIADRKAEEDIRAYIKSRFPKHGFIGEEGGQEKGEAGECMWIIDPIDGTKNFIRGIPIFGTMIALLLDGEPIVGVSNAPVLKERLVAAKGSGAFLNGKQIHVSEVDAIGDAYFSYGSLITFEKKGLMENLLTLERATWRSRCFGDLWAFHLLAQGKIDAVVEVNLKIWDIAALRVIIEEAGGRMTDLLGGKIASDSTAVVATNGLIHDAVLGVLNGSSIKNVL